MDVKFHWNWSNVHLPWSANVSSSLFVNTGLRRYFGLRLKVASWFFSWRFFQQLIEKKTRKYWLLCQFMVSLPLFLISIASLIYLLYICLVLCLWPWPSHNTITYNNMIFDGRFYDCKQRFLPASSRNNRFANFLTLQFWVRWDKWRTWPLKIAIRSWLGNLDFLHDPPSLPPGLLHPISYVFLPPLFRSRTHVYVCIYPFDFSSIHHTFIVYFSKNNTRGTCHWRVTSTADMC